MPMINLMASMIDAIESTTHVVFAWTRFVINWAAIPIFTILLFAGVYLAGRKKANYRTLIMAIVSALFLIVQATFILWTVNGLSGAAEDAVNMSVAYKRAYTARYGTSMVSGLDEKESVGFAIARAGIDQARTKALSMYIAAVVATGMGMAFAHQRNRSATG